ncbi:acyltransferase [Riemerella anatipestifer]|uniref:acyltransferase family protein n=1 Tax=Riemerella anatipestifer TaxID=34085 RepID=UPI0007EC2FD1|nr:acyltransferase [Riemerella anatipestifer]MRM95009.1 acyltransferase [Riemerella anatipestifer]MRM96338.1 acyltransferase [Riemerella anatipestifer]MRN00677.1 acyltransferase [Riemerella anatipestifer]MRN02867.1 acyltransferase [Riemerella anatipestifer]
MTRDNNITFLRLLLALTVFTRHLFALTNETTENFVVIKFLSFSIYSFFIISGMLVFASLEKNPNLITYAKRRIKRIYPAYLFTILFFSIVLYFFSNLDLKDYFSARYWQYISSNLIFLNFLSPCINDVFSSNTICAVNGSLWTLKIEVGFYSILPFIYILLKSRPSKTQNIILIFLYSISYFYFYYLAEIKGNYLYAKQLPGALMYFICGILLYKNYHLLKKYINYLIIPAIILIFLKNKIDLLDILFPFALAINIFWLSFSAPKINYLLLKGDLSYGIYLFHFPIIQIFIQLGYFNRHFTISCFMVFIIVIICSYFSWYFLEKPFLKNFSKNI